MPITEMLLDEQRQPVPQLPGRHRAGDIGFPKRFVLAEKTITEQLTIRVTEINGEPCCPSFLRFDPADRRVSIQYPTNTATSSSNWTFRTAHYHYDTVTVEDGNMVFVNCWLADEEYSR